MLCQERSVRLVGGTLAAEGRVELCINETWGTICDNSWSTNDANVICGQLGYLTRGKDMIRGVTSCYVHHAFPGAVAYPNARFGQGTGPILYNNLQCTGSEDSVFDCMSDGLGMSGTCSHSDDAAVMCQEGLFCES